jgi:hypothetical protein
MTAIGVSGTRHGIIVGADGCRSVDAKSRAAEPERAKAHEGLCAQKIFPIQGSDRNLAYALAGNIANPDLPFDAVTNCATIAEDFRLRDIENKTKFVNGFCKTLCGQIQKAKHLPELEKNANGDWIIMDLVFAGYFKSDPFVFYAQFSHSLRFAEFHSQEITLAGLLYGSDVVRKKMYDNGEAVKDSPFAQYIQDPKQIQLLDDSERYVRGYIEACSTTLALTMDEARCKKIGGHIHVGELTPTGFRWRIPPIKTEEHSAV